MICNSEMIVSNLCFEFDMVKEAGIFESHSLNYRMLFVHHRILYVEANNVIAEKHK